MSSRIPTGFRIALALVLLTLGFASGATAGTSATPADYFTVTPCRVFDSRFPDDPFEGPGGAPSRREFPVGVCAVPAEASAVSLNITIVQPTAGGFLVAYDADLSSAPAPYSTLNFPAGAIRGNNAIVGVSATGLIAVELSTSFTATDTAHVTIDLVGYFVNNLPPALTAGGTLNYTEGDAPTAIDTTITVTDPDSANLASATVQISGNYQNGADVLSFTNTPNITGVFAPATGTLTLTGTDTLANWQTALRSVAYNNTSDNPNTLARTVTWIVNDGSSSSTPDPDTSTINVAGVNDAPSLTAGGTLTYPENAPPTAIDTTITVTDPDSANLASATVQITGNYQNGEDVLSFTNTPNITGVFAPATGTLTLTGTDTLANWQTALRSVAYSNTSDAPSTLARTVTWIVNDGSASSTPDPDTSTINVTSSNKPPELTAGGTLNYSEGDAPTAIDTTITVTDPDNVNLASATVQITGNYQNGQDVLSFINTPNITGVFAPATGTLTLTGTDTVANWQTALRSVRYNNTSDNPSTLARTVTWIVNDGSASSTPDPDTSTINVAGVNDAPSLTAGGTLNYTEGDAPTAIDTTITVTDPDSANLASATVQITGNYQNGADVLSFINTPNITGVFTPATGTLTLTGTDTLANWQTALRSVRYNNTSDNPSTLARTVTWIVNDGSASSTPDPDTSTINVAGVNDAPSLTAGGTLNYTEGDAPTAIDTTITVTDPDSANLASATVQITGNYQNGQDVLSFINTPNITGVFAPATGTLTLTGTDTLANWQTALRSVRYNNTSDNPSTLARTVTWIVNDGSASSTPDPDTSTINVTGANDAPSLTAGGTLNYTEGDAPTAIDTTITVTDPDSTNLASATVQITGNYQNGADVLSFINTPNITGIFTPATGTLTLTGTDTVANWQTALRSVRYNNTSDNPSTLARTVTWIVSDGSASSTPDPDTSTINVAGVNDAPSLTAGGTLNYTENDAPTAIDTTITVTDPDNANLASATVQITGNYQNGQDVLSFINTPNITGVFAPATGTLTLTGTDTLANWQTALRNVRYHNTSENPSTLARTVTWIISDGSASSTPDPDTSTINVTAVPDAPVTMNDTDWDTIGNTRLIVAATDPGPDANGPYVFVTGNVLANDTDPDSPTLTASLANANGATVTMNGDGTFTYVPPAGAPGPTHSFTYNASDGVLSTPGTVIIDLISRVWYVRNNAPAGGNGTSTLPFNAITVANLSDNGGDGDLTDDADFAGDYIFVYFGDGTASSQSTGLMLEGTQHLIGEHVGLSIPITSGSFNGVAAPTTVNLVTAAPGNRPLLDDTVVDAVEGIAARDVIPIEIVGLNLAGNVNAIDWTTTTAFAGTGTLTVRDNVIRSAAADGVDINLAGTGSVNLAFHDNNLTATGTALDIQETGTGSLTITAFHDNVVTSASAGAGLNVNTAVFDASSAPGIQPVPGGATVIGTPGDRINGPGLNLNNVTGALNYANALSGTIGAGDLDIFTDSGAALSVAGGVGGFVFDVTPTMGVLVANAGPAAIISGADIDLQLNSLTSSNSLSNGVSLTNVTGTFSAPSGSSITNAGTTDFAISGGTANVTYNGTITDDVGQLVSIASATGGTKSFTGAITDGDDGDGSGISLTGNSASTTMRFSGGVVLSTGGNPAFAATGGGTVEVCDENPCNPGATGLAVNKITTTTATALNVANTSIGANNLEFRSISVDGNDSLPTNGIVLNTTGSAGGLSVKGTGSANSGGTIQDTSGDAVLLTSTERVSLGWMNLTSNLGSGIRGNTVRGFVLEDSSITSNGDQASPDEAGVELVGLTGTAIGGARPTKIEDTTISNNFEFQLQVTNSTGTLTDFQMNNNTISSTGASGTIGNLVNFLNIGTSTMTLNAAGGSYTGNAPATATGLNADTSGSGGSVTANVSAASFTNNNVAVTVSAAQGGALTFDVHDNPTVTGNRSHGLNLFIADGTTGTVSGKFRNNQVGTNGVTGSGSSLGFGIRVQNEAISSATIEIDGNTVRELAQFAAINVNHGIVGSDFASTMNVTITDNVIDDVDNSRAIIVQQNVGQGTTCANIARNDMSDIAGNIGDGTKIRIRQLAGGTFNVTQGQATAAATATELDNANSPPFVVNTTTDAQISASGTFTYNAPACPLP